MPLNNCLHIVKEVVSLQDLRGFYAATAAFCDGIVATGQNLLNLGLMHQDEVIEPPLPMVECGICHRGVMSPRRKASNRSIARSVEVTPVLSRFQRQYLRKSAL